MNTKLRLMIVLGILGLVLTYMGGSDWIVLSKPAKDITELWEVDYHDLKAGDHVCFDVNLVWDQIGSETTTNKTYGVTTSERESARYYLLPFCRDKDDEFIYPSPFLMVKLGGQYNDLMSEQISKTDEWWYGNGDLADIPTTSIHIDGKLVKMPNDIRKQIKATLDAGEDIEDYMIPVIFQKISAPGAVKGMTIVGIVLIMAFLVILFFVIKGSATAVQQPIPGVRREPFVPQGGAAGAGMQGNPGSAFAQQGMSQQSFGTANTAPQQSGAYGAGNTASQQSFGTGNTAPQQSGAFGAGNAAVQQSVNKQGSGASPYSTATLETTQIPYIPGISLGPDPSKQGPAPSQTFGGTAPLGPSSISGSVQSGPSAVSGPSSILGSAPLGPSSSQGPQPLGPSSVLDGSQSESSLIPGNTPAPAVLPLGGGGANVQASTQPAAPAKQPAEPEEDENAPLYADNTEMKKVFKGAFASPANNGNRE